MRAWRSVHGGSRGSRTQLGGGPPEGGAQGSSEEGASLVWGGDCFLRGTHGLTMPRGVLLEISPLSSGGEPVWAAPVCVWGSLAGLGWSGHLCFSPAQLIFNPGTSAAKGRPNDSYRAGWAARGASGGGRGREQPFVGVGAVLRKKPVLWTISNKASLAGGSAAGCEHRWCWR